MNYDFILRLQLLLLLLLLLEIMISSLFFRNLEQAAIFLLLLIINSHLHRAHWLQWKIRSFSSPYWNGTFSLFRCHRRYLIIILSYLSIVWLINQDWLRLDILILSFVKRWFSIKRLTNFRRIYLIGLVTNRSSQGVNHLCFSSHRFPNYHQAVPWFKGIIKLNNFLKELNCKLDLHLWSEHLQIIYNWTTLSLIG